MTTLQVTALEGQHQGETLNAQFDQTQVIVEHAVQWQRQLDKGPADLEFERVEPARMSLRLLLDGTKSSSSVQPQIDKLHHFASVDPILRRPPKVELSAGNGAGVLPAFTAVIEAVTVRYNQFADNGVPLRATADLKLTQAGHLAIRAS